MYAAHDKTNKKSHTVKFIFIGCEVGKHANANPDPYHDHQGFLVATARRYARKQVSAKGSHQLND